MADERNDLDLDLDDDLQQTMDELTQETDVEDGVALGVEYDEELDEEDAQSGASSGSLLPKIVAGALAFVLVMGGVSYGAYSFMTKDALPQVVTVESSRQPAQDVQSEAKAPRQPETTAEPVLRGSIPVASASGQTGLDLSALPFSDTVGASTSAKPGLTALTTSADDGLSKIASGQVSGLTPNTAAVTPKARSSVSAEVQPDDTAVDNSIVQALRTDLDRLRTQMGKAETTNKKLNRSLAKANGELAAAQTEKAKTAASQRLLLGRLQALEQQITARDLTIAGFKQTVKVAAVLDERVRLGRFYIISDKAIDFTTDGEQKRAVLAKAPSGRTVTLFAGEIVKLGKTRLEVKQIAQDGGHVVIGSKWFIDRKDVGYSSDEGAMRDRVVRRASQSAAPAGSSSNPVIIGNSGDVQTVKSTDGAGFEKGRKGYQFIGYMPGGIDGATLMAVINTPTKQRIVAVDDEVDGLGKVTQVSESHLVIGNVFFSKVSL